MPSTPSSAARPTCTVRSSTSSSARRRSTTACASRAGWRVHEHLVRQHFLPKDVHTLERKDANVTAIVDKGKFSEPFEIARDADGESDARGGRRLRAAHRPTECRRSVSATLKAAFADNGFTLSAKARGRGLAEHAVDDHRRSFRHDDEHVHDQLRRLRVGRIRRAATGGSPCCGRALSIDDKPSGKEIDPDPALPHRGQNDTFRGKSHAGGSTPIRPTTPQEPTNKARFDAVRAVLEQGTFAGGTVDIEAELGTRRRSI